MFKSEERGLRARWRSEWEWEQVWGQSGDEDADTDTEGDETPHTNMWEAEMWALWQAQTEAALSRPGRPAGASAPLSVTLTKLRSGPR